MTPLQTHAFLTMTTSAPVLFVSHGAPTLVLEGGPSLERLTELGAKLEGCKAMVVLSPHWRSRGYEISSGPKPGTWHDFYGFPKALYDLEYPAPGQPELAARVAALIPDAQLNPEQPFDHGVWSPLMLMRPQADIPIVQVSMPQQATAQSLYALGQALAPLTREGVALVASGSLTHHLGEVSFGSQLALPHVERFQQWVRDALALSAPEDLLLNPGAHSADFARVHPHDDHYLPLLFALGAVRATDPAVESRRLLVMESPIMHAALSMESYCWN